MKMFTIQVGIYSARQVHLLLLLRKIQTEFKMFTAQRKMFKIYIDLHQDYYKDLLQCSKGVLVTILEMIYLIQINQACGIQIMIRTKEIIITKKQVGGKGNLRQRQLQSVVIPGQIVEIPDDEINSKNEYPDRKTTQQFWKIYAYIFNK